jgi:hypothetical protein
MEQVGLGIGLPPFSCIDMLTLYLHLQAIAWNGVLRTVGGTSASSPAFAAVISLVNDALLAADKPVLGFLNPWIYGGAYKALTDVTSGSSIGCNSSGFPAQVGWDAVTGWGTPVSLPFPLQFHTLNYAEESGVSCRISSSWYSARLASGKNVASLDTLLLNGALKRFSY